MATTTNFGWETPDDSDLVKDGAAAMRTLGNSIDASFVDLKGGTSGQVLSKNSNTDLDFTWVAQDDSNAIQNAIVDAKGDLIAASGADTPARLAVGTNEHRLVAASAETTGLKYVADTTNYAIAAKGDLLVGTAADTLQALSVGTNGYTLVADSNESLGVKWQAPAGGKILQVVQATTSTLKAISTTAYADSNLTASITPSSASSKVLILVTQPLFTGNTASDEVIAKWQLLRSSTAILENTRIGHYAETASPAGANQWMSYVTASYLDSPSTTSSTTYKTQIGSTTSAGNIDVQAQVANLTAVMILMEVGA